MDRNRDSTHQSQNEDKNNQNNQILERSYK